MQQRSTGDGVLLSFPFVRLVQQVKMINLKAHMQLKQKADKYYCTMKAITKTLTTRY